MLKSPRLTLFVSAFWVALVPGSVLFAWMQWKGYAAGGMVGADAHAYWLAVREPDTWYTRPPGSWDAYLYSPLFVQVIWPLGQLPWTAFQACWLGLQLALSFWLLKPLGWARGLTVLLMMTPELVLGNVYVFYAGAIVLALSRCPEVLTLPLATKIYPSIVGLWFVVRGEWRLVGRMVLGAVVLIGASVALAPSAWVAWVRFLVACADTGDGTYALARFVLAAGLTVWAARGSRPWVLAVAMVLATPILGAYTNLVPLIAIPRLLRVSATPRAAVPGSVPGARVVGRADVAAGAR